MVHCIIITNTQEVLSLGLGDDPMGGRTSVDSHFHNTPHIV
jgi:hypothetical protein